MNSLNQNPSNPDTHEIRPLVLKNNTLTEPPSTFRVLSCIDMDAFFAQAEARRFGYDDTVSLVVIHFRVCIAVTYAARKYGVTRIMPIDEIKKLCPHIILVHVDTIKVGQEPIDPYKRDLKDKLNINRKWDQEKTCLDYYRFESDKVFAILKRMCPIVEKASIDENFLDFTEEAVRIYNTGNYEMKWEGKVPGYEGKIPETKEEILLMIGSQIAAKIRKEVHDTLKYTCTAGISHNKMLAKLASSLNKPNDQTIILKQTTLEVLKPLEIRKLRNFGGKVAQAFEKSPYKTLGDLHGLNLEEIKNVIKDYQHAKYIYFRCRGYDNDKVEVKKDEGKTLGSSKSFDNEVMSLEGLVEVEDMFIADLVPRITRFYDETEMTPHTISAHYWDNSTKTSRSKSMGINLQVRQERFGEVLKVKIKELFKAISNVLFPCKYIGVGVRNFQKSDIKNIGFDLRTYMKDKQKEKESVRERRDGNSGINIQGGTSLFRDNGPNNHINENTMIIEEMENNNSTFYHDNSIQSYFTNQNHTDKIEMEIVVEKVTCEKCGQLIEEASLSDHLDMHIAEELDRELNPNKRKYRKVDSGEVVANFQGKEFPAKDVPKIMENRTIKNESKLLDPPKRNNKKSVEKNKENKSSQMRTLDSFFRK